MSGAYDFRVAQQLVASGPPVDALIMAAFLLGDPDNRTRIATAFPTLVAEIRARYNAPGGKLPEDGS